MNMTLPSKGQPIDSSYIRTIVDNLNALSTSLSTQASNSQVYTQSTGNRILRTADLMVVAGYEKITNSSTATTTEVTRTHQFGLTFGTPPIVTATPVLTDSVASKITNVYVTNITTTSVDIVVKFSTVDTSSVGVNLIAIGIKNS